MTQQKSQLHKILWEIANTLRGNMGADEFRDYILGFIFYKYLSEKTLYYANTQLATEGKNYKELPSEESDPYIAAIKKEALSSLGYFILPNQLFSSVVNDIKSSDAIAEKGQMIKISLFKSSAKTEIVYSKSLDESDLKLEEQDYIDDMLKNIRFCTLLPPNSHDVINKQFNGDRGI